MKQKYISCLLFVLTMATSLFLVTGSGLTDGQLVRGDVNGDNAINMKDVLLLRKYLAELPVEFADHVCTAETPSQTQAPSWTMPTAATEPSVTEPSTTEPSATVPTQSQTQPSATEPTYTVPSQSQTQPSVTEPSQSQPAGDTVALSLSVTEHTPDKWTAVTRTDSFNVPTGENTVAIILPAVWHGKNDYPETTAKTLANLSYNGAALTPVVTYGETKNNANDIILTYTLNVTAAGTLSGTVDHPAFKAFRVAVNGEGGGEPTKPSKDSTPVVPKENADVDLVTLTFADESASSYGVSFHSFESLTSLKVQVVKGAVTDAAAFAGATEFAASTTSAKMGEFEGYNPLNYDFYYTNATEVTSYQHKATLSGLDAGTTYSYRVGDGATGKWSPIYTFTTKPATVGNFSFIFTADFQPELPEEGLMYKGVAQVMNAAVGLCPNPAFILHGGDFVYTDANGQNGISQWRNVINGCNNWSESSRAFFAEHPWGMAAGNHDSHKTPFFFNYDNQAAAGDTQSLYYSFDYGDMHIVSLDTDVLAGAGVNAAQLSWLQNDLASTDKKWKIVETHYSFYVNTNRDLEDYGTSDTDRTTLLNLFDQYGVDVVLSAHVVQNYYTTYPLKAGAVTTTAVTNQGGVDYYTNPGGTVYLQNGASGNSFGIENEEGKINGYGWSYPSLMKDSEAGHYGSFAVVELNGNALTVNRYYLDEATKEVKTYARGQFGIIKT